MQILHNLSQWQVRNYSEDDLDHDLYLICPSGEDADGLQGLGKEKRKQQK